MNRLGALVAAFLAASVVSPGAAAATPIPPGKWSFVWKDAKGHPERPMRVYTYRPKACDSTCPIVFVLHGLHRHASAYRDYWELRADRYRVLVVAPEFSDEMWPRAAAYNLGEVGREADREKWAFATIEHLFDEVRDRHESYALFGHSAGGQFAHRMAFFRPDSRASVIVAANPGWYTMPEWRSDKAKDPFPYSLVGSPAGASELKRALARRVVVLLGEKDDDPRAADLSHAAGAEREGATRLERGENFYKAATAAAAELGVPFAWELVEVPGVAHSGEAMSKAAADAIFKKP
jgi:poly(3-hydroxybutyrate) depolymerase